MAKRNLPLAFNLLARHVVVDAVTAPADQPPVDVETAPLPTDSLRRRERIQLKQNLIGHTLVDLLEWVVLHLLTLLIQSVPRLVNEHVAKHGCSRLGLVVELDLLDHQHKFQIVTDIPNEAPGLSDLASIDDAPVTVDGSEPIADAVTTGESTKGS